MNWPIVFGTVATLLAIDSSIQWSNDKKLWSAIGFFVDIGLAAFWFGTATA